MGPIRSINTSKAYWELKAEQVMDRVFQPASAQQAELNDAIEVDVRETTSTEANRTSSTLRLQSRQWLLAGLILCALGSGLGLYQGWSSAQRQLRLERNARLLSDLRNLTPNEEPATSEALPPPPPEEAWITQLPALPALPSESAAPAEALPELVGVVQIPGQRGSAIFQQGKSSSNALIGEQIGSSGWRLVSIQSDGAVIERSGVRRRVSIGAGF
ncbi:hypothetical protein [Vulcanococcus sp.]|uniref:hypothetical protein n=1 Tax=Vulcanococcus sp. TaxID=2856995 RepID=UPI003BFD3FDD